MKVNEIQTLGSSCKKKKEKGGGPVMAQWK